MKKVLLKGPLLTQSGYGHHARTILRALKTREDLFDVYIQAISWGKTSWQWEDTEERQWIDDKLQKTIGYIETGGQFDMSVQISIPNEWEKLAPVNIGVTAGIETTKVSPQWIEKSYLMDKIITISEHSKSTYENTSYKAENPETGEIVEVSCTTPITAVSYPVRKFEPEKLDLKLTTKFNFLSVIQISPRKNMEQLVRNFIEKFKDNEDVGLILKGNLAKNSLIDRKNTLNGLRGYLSKHTDRKCKIYLLHGYMTDEQMAGLYTHPKIKVMVSTTHGEGFGLPLFEAAYYGMPVIATDWSGHVDFLYKPVKQKNGKTKKKHMFSRISYTLQPIQKESVWDGILQPDSMWAYPEDGSIKMNLDEVYKDHGRFKKRAKELQKWICEEFTEERKYNELVTLIDYDNYSDSVDEIENLFKEASAG